MESSEHSGLVTRLTCLDANSACAIDIKAPTRQSFADAGRQWLHEDICSHQTLEPPRKRQRLSTSPSTTRSFTPVYDREHMVQLLNVRLELDFTEGPESSTESLAIDELENQALLLTEVQQHSSTLTSITVLSCRTKRTLQVVLEHDEGTDLITQLEWVHALSTSQSSKRQKPAAVAVPEFRLMQGQTSTRFEISARVLWRIADTSGRMMGCVTDLELNILRACLPQRHATGVNLPWTVEDFYSSTHMPSRSLTVSKMVKEVVEGKLYPFQQRTVAWLLQREGAATMTKADLLDDPSNGASVPGSRFHAIKDLANRECHADTIRGAIFHGPVPPVDEMDGLRGGILAEEMGLGKTVELIALICCHKRNLVQPIIVDTEVPRSVTPSASTLIITPQHILQQWKSELALHAPHLKVLHYTGLQSMQKENKDPDGASVQRLLTYDVVLTTYSVLSREIHWAKEPTQRQLRHEKRYSSRRSPLVQVGWWRVCLDEAQMVESGVSQAAIVAQQIPREMAWAVSGTPLKKDTRDLLGLLVFLRLEPFYSERKLWAQVDKRTMSGIFGAISLRHSKASVSDDLRLPPQSRTLMKVPFTVIEEQHYEEIFKEMCESCKVDISGAPLSDDWDPASPLIIDRMRKWLRRLRQTCLHPQIATKGGRTAGRGARPIRTVDEVLQSMFDQKEAAVRAEERKMLLAMLLKGQILGNDKSDQLRSARALEVFEAAMVLSSRAVDDCRRLCEIEKTNSSLQDQGREGDPLNLEEDHLELVNAEESQPRLAAIQKALRGSLEILHMCSFFVATSHYQIKSNEQITEPDSDRFRELDALESEGYEAAKTVRKELLLQPRAKAEALMRKVKTTIATDIPSALSVSLDGFGGIEGRRLLPDIEVLLDTLNSQASEIRTWRTKVVDILMLPLVDEEESLETTGDEYESSTKAQDELYVYTTVLRASIADRQCLLTGQVNELTAHESSVALQQARQGLGHSPELLEAVMEIRAKYQPKPEALSLRGIVAKARSTAHSLQWQHDGGSHRAGLELSIIERLIARLSPILLDRSKELANLEKDLDSIHLCMNLRLEFYRQLQLISDTVAKHKEEMDDTIDQALLQRTEQTERTARERMAIHRTKIRFLQHLRERAASDEGLTPCAICQDPIEVGVLTVCGHQYCKECIGLWWSENRKCPVCRIRLKTVDFHDISYRSRELRAEAESDARQYCEKPRVPSPHAPDPIYSMMRQSIIGELIGIDLKGSFGTKIDTLARHILLLRTKDVGAKSLIFSQYSDFLQLLGVAFQKFRIGFTSMQNKGGVERFRSDESTECFLLDAKTDSSGLNLVNAAHVFICEPLINPAIELQAIARVHRIGQQRPTSVYMYVISDTIEQNIYQTSVERRMQHIKSNKGGHYVDKQHSGDPSADGIEGVILDAANAEEVQKAPLSKLVSRNGGGEIVNDDDLWSCLFAGRSTRATMSSSLQTELNRNVRAEAAEQRVDGA